MRAVIAVAICLIAGAASAYDEIVAHVGDTPQRHDIIPATQPRMAPKPERVALGRQLFMDTRLSSPAGVSCASCHDPASGFSSLNGGKDGVPLGSIRTRLGVRNPPSLMYARYIPPMYFWQEDDAPAPQPFGGLFLDGRAASFEEQMREPLLAAHEMNNGTEAAVMKRLKDAGYTAAFEAEYGRGALATPKRAMEAMGASLAAFLRSDELSPFSSRFDDMLRGQGTLNAQEMRGLAVFRNPDVGNCASCHTLSVTSSNPERSLFTDFGYDAIGVPRNRRLPANQDAGHFDLGLCGTAEKHHWPDGEAWCGYFRTSSLRNVAVRERFMHNGVFSSLRDAVAFYATRSIKPQDWYGKAQPFDDLPAAMQGNVNIVSTPFNRRTGMKPAMSDDDIDAVVAFLKTLTDARYAGAKTR